MNRKHIIVIGAVTIGALVAGSSFAFWTASGEDEVTTSVDAGASTLTLDVSVADGIYPGGASDVTFSATNPGDYAVTIGTLGLESVSSDVEACDTSDFSMDDVVVNEEIAAGETITLAATGSLEYAKTAVNQDACKGATLTLNVATK